MRPLAFLARAKRLAVKNRAKQPRRKLCLESLESRRVFTLPTTLSTFDRYAFAYNGPTVDTIHEEAGLIAAGSTKSYLFVPQFTGNYVINAEELTLAIDPEVAIYNASTGTRLAYNNDISVFNDNARLNVGLTAFTQYIVAVGDRTGTNNGIINLDIAAPFRTPSAVLTVDNFGDVSGSEDISLAGDIDYISIISPPDATGQLKIYPSSTNFSPTIVLFDSVGRRMLGPTLGPYPGILPNQEYRLAVMSSIYDRTGTFTALFDFSEPGAVVTNTLDSGPGSLRQAILDTNGHPNIPRANDEIRFTIPGDGPHVINVLSPLPAITDPVTILGPSRPAGAMPKVVLDGAALAGPVDGLQILASGSEVSGLGIRNFPGDGIEIRADNVGLFSNSIGVDEDGLLSRPNRGFGVLVQDGSNNTVTSNIVAGNGLSGIAILGEAADNNRVSSNQVGIRQSGAIATAIPNGGNGILIFDGDSNRLIGNTVSGNTLAGVVFSGSATLNSLEGNKVGTNTNGTAAVPNGGDGVFIQSARNTLTANGATRNVISGNVGSGIALRGSTATGNVVEGSNIGTDASGMFAIPNLGDGIRVVGAPNTRIGTATNALNGNVISGNVGSGVSVSQAGSTNTVIWGNFIGTQADGLAGLGNGGSGVLLSAGATNVRVGGGNPTSRNIIAANRGSGVFISSTVNNIEVTRNRIGVDLNGAALGNIGTGVAIQGSSNVIGGSSATLANIIAGNAQGILLSGSSATGNQIAFNTVGTSAARNIGAGIQVSGASNNVIGPGNAIRHNDTGVRIDANSSQIRITENSIANNTNLGIDLLPAAGATPNDVGDSDVGANRLQNFPLMTADPELIGNDLQVSFQFSSSPTNSAYPLTVEFYVSDAGGEGATFIASTFFTTQNLTQGNRLVAFAGAGAGLTAGVTRIVAIATDALGNSSEFSGLRRLVDGLALAQRSQTPTQGRNVLDVDGNNRLTSVDALLVIASIETNSGAVLRASNSAAERPEKFDVDRNGVVDLQDVWLVIRGIQLSQSKPKAVSAASRLIATQIWDASLLEEITKDMPEVRSALSRRGLVPVP